MGATTLRMGVTFLRPWVPQYLMGVIPLIILVLALAILALQARKKDSIQALAFWQAVIRYGVAYDLACFGWEKICHLQLVMPLSKMDLPFSSFSRTDLFWAFYSQSYVFGCIIAGFQILGAVLLQFHRTRLAGVFILLPVLGNILLMDIFYQIGDSVVVHASIMMAGLLYLLLVDFDRLKAFFFTMADGLPTLRLASWAKWTIRLSVIYVPLLLIALHGNPDKYPALTGKYEVKNHVADSIPTVVYFDIRNQCVFEFNSPLGRWTGTFTKKNDSLFVDWRTPAGRPGFRGTIVADSVGLLLNGVSGSDTLHLELYKAPFRKPQA